MTSWNSAEITDLPNQSADERERVQSLMAQGRWHDAEDNTDRLQQYPAKKTARLAPPGTEALVGSTIDFQSASFLTRGPEGLRLDPDFSNRSGYDPAFIPGAANLQDRGTDRARFRRRRA